MLAFRVQFAGDVNKKNIVRSNGSLERIRSRFTRAYPLEPELPSAIEYFFKFNSYQIKCFFEAMGLHRTLDLNSNPMDSTHSRIFQTNDKLSGNSGKYEWAQDAEA